MTLFSRKNKSRIEKKKFIINFLNYLMKIIKKKEDKINHIKYNKDKINKKMKKKFVI